MKERQAECVLSVLYTSSAIFSVTGLICLATIWQYWAWILNVCISIDCGCILYGINTFRTFMGGDAKLCHFGVYGLIPTLLIGLCLGGYHGYRCCIDKSIEEPVQMYDDAARNLNKSEATVVVRVKRRTPYEQWIPAVFLAVLLCCLSLVHAVLTTDGYYKTCNNYRRRLIQILDSRGREAEVIHNRLSCGAIFDFMDYLQSDVVVDQNTNWERGKETDTGFVLRLTIISTWLNFIAWMFIVLFNIVIARKKFRCC
ncbi:uncharacterized protein LOC114876082 [Osmia bicornis bicornis]|uniref:uncharacterized protein LOC114876082 n=1 Tax=Osmia bicornis bicornis TaxID=1437191 RepID=UPI0010F5457B|nr:uncharacterized protein LOC114876082 [Osmia bicornis bicornis]XP_029042969.1 uncharacterized protein LOC114876082 [Osmia bicornis bicornis]XP_029042970.1 uncharacterized protein LOC114876082 [Osmia bicornis bicornis]